MNDSIASVNLCYECLLTAITSEFNEATRTWGTIESAARVLFEPHVVDCAIKMLEHTQFSTRTESGVRQKTN